MLLSKVKVVLPARVVGAPAVAAPPLLDGAAAGACGLPWRFKIPWEKTASMSSKTKTEHEGAEENTGDGGK